MRPRAVATLGVVLGCSSYQVSREQMCADYCERFVWRDMQEIFADPEIPKRRANPTDIVGVCGIVDREMYESCVSSCVSPRASACTEENEAYSRCESRLACDEVLERAGCERERRALGSCDLRHAGPK